MATQVLILISILVTFGCHVVESAEKLEQRGEKALSLFNIIRFPNSPCSGSGNRNGTCYTEMECLEKNGIATGTCASGYGICCAFAATCGQTARENCTYFESASVPIGSCRLKICKTNDDICQIRLDFNTFVIVGPSVSTKTFDYVAFISNGNPTQVLPALQMTDGTQCKVDRFSVTSPGSSSPPTICGTNTGEHMYVDASDACNDLAFQLGSSTSVNRQWSIKVTQYACDYENLAPSGCTQYHFGQDTGVVKTYNYDGGAHLANQHQKICIRQEQGNCQVCYNPVTETDFDVSGSLDDTGFTLISECCGYGSDGIGFNGYDCLIIPGASQKDGGKINPGSHFCGDKLVTSMTTLARTNKTVCSKQQPFYITFLSDKFENSSENFKDFNVGFRLLYTQSGC